MKSKMLLCFLSLFMAAAGASANERIYVNREVTTHIVMPENIKMVDISTTKIAGNQCTDNIVRIKPSCGSDSIPEAGYRDNELLGTLTLIGERHIAQYDILYTQSPQMAASIFEVPYSHTQSYINPEVTMPMAEMARYAWAVYGSGRKYNQIVSRAHGMKAVVNNIYAVGDYFFIDYSLQNRAKIAYDIEELRVKLADKKETKATNSQTIELSPVFSLNHVRKFKKSYRNVLVLPKLTFPDEKVLRLEISENQISGRVITLTIEYEDIYGNAVKVFGEVGNHWRKPDFWKGYYWDGGIVYKHRLARYKNGMLRFRFGPQFGAVERKFFLGLEGGFEYSYVFRNGWEFSLTQKNNVNFIHGDTFRNGMLLGFKIPF